jgi:DNA polymerase-3 subunit epsilon
MVAKSHPHMPEPRIPFERFAAIDFETADNGRDSACAIAVVLVESGCITKEFYSLIKPPRKTFLHSWLHGITWDDVVAQPSFHELWPEIVPLFSDVEFIAAHNAPFDRTVFNTCCTYYNLPSFSLPYLCTVRLSRTLWNIRPTKLSDVCTHFNIPLNHHHAGSDAHACAQIVLKSKDRGIPKNAFLGTSIIKKNHTTI